ncbi:MAG: hypothetical protein U0790_00565 [Isosphaeraceae bacterium]
MQTIRLIWLGVGLCILGTAIGPVPARADYTPLFSNLSSSTFTGFGYTSGSGAATVGGSLSSVLIADDITAGPGLGGYGVNRIDFTVANLNSVAVSVGVNLRIFAGDGAGGGPGTLLAGLNFNPSTFAASSINAFSFTSAASIFTMPSTTFWAALSFNNFGGSTGVTAAQLNNLGMGLFDPPTVGSSQDVFFQSSAASLGNTSNPAGGFYFFGGNPRANFGFAFFTASVVPEPPSATLAGLAMLALGAFGLRYRPRIAA